MPLAPSRRYGVKLCTIITCFSSLKYIAVHILTHVAGSTRTLLGCLSLNTDNYSRSYGICLVRWWGPSFLPCTAAALRLLPPHNQLCSMRKERSSPQKNCFCGECVYFYHILACIPIQDLNFVVKKCYSWHLIGGCFIRI